jgi:hypothetical protein
MLAPDARRSLAGTNVAMMGPRRQRGASPNHNCRSSESRDPPRNLSAKHMRSTPLRNNLVLGLLGPDFQMAKSSSREHALAFPLRVFVRVMPQPLPLERQRRRECRVQAAPMARLQQRKQAAVTTVQPKHPASPSAMVLRLIRGLPGVRALIATVALRTISPRSIPASGQRRGDQDDTTSPSTRMPSSARRAR